MDEKYLFFYTLGMKVAEAELELEKEAAKKTTPQAQFEDLNAQVEEMRKLRDQIKTLIGSKSKKRKRAPVLEEYKPFGYEVASSLRKSLLPKEYAAAAEAVENLRRLGKTPKDLAKFFRQHGVKTPKWYYGGKLTEALLRNIALHPRAAGAAGLAALLGGGYGIGKGIEALSD